MLVLLLAACSPAGPKLGASGMVPGGVPLAPEHTLSAGDEFEIRFPFAPDYNDRVTVGMDGTVAPKQIGSVAVGGLTVDEARQRLEQRYAAVLKAPQLSITLRRYAPEVIYVDGWVAHPGLVRSEMPLTLERAIARAGGVKTGAKTENVLVMRHDADGGLRTYSVALGPHEVPVGDDPMLKSFDVVYVPQTALASVSEFARQYYANVPFSFGFNVTRPRATIVAPQVVSPGASPPPIVTPR